MTRLHHTRSYTFSHIELDNMFNKNTFETNAIWHTQTPEILDALRYRIMPSCSSIDIDIRSSKNTNESIILKVKLIEFDDYMYEPDGRLTAKINYLTSHNNCWGTMYVVYDTKWLSNSVIIEEMDVDDMDIQNFL